MTKEQFLDGLFSQMIIVVDRNKYSRYILFKIKDKIYMEYNQKNGRLWCDWRTIWSILLSEYGCNETEISELIKGMVEQHFKIDAATPLLLQANTDYKVEQHFKIDAATPGLPTHHSRLRVLEHFKIK